MPECICPAYAPDQLLDREEWALALVMEAPDAGGVLVFDRPAGLLAPPPGLLRIFPEQYEALRDGRVARSRARIARFLKRHLPPPLEHLSDTDIDRIVIESEAVSRQLGLRTERGRARWAYLMMMSGGEAGATREATDFVRQGPDPDRRVKDLIGHTAHALRSSAAGDGT